MMHIQNRFLIILITILSINGFAQDTVDIVTTIIDTTIIDTTVTGTTIIDNIIIETL